MTLRGPILIAGTGAPDGLFVTGTYAGTFVIIPNKRQHGGENECSRSFSV
jgi:hypothetical protein